MKARSVVAVVAGLVVIFALSLGTDQIFHMLGVYPPWGQWTTDTGVNALALSYRLVYSVLGCYLTARLAPHAPMKHALVLGAIGFVLSAFGAIAASRMNLDPLWYPLALVVTAVPCAWLGGALYRPAISLRPE